MAGQASPGPQHHPRAGSPRAGTRPGRGRSLFTRVSAAWVAIAVVLALLVLMIIFMLQNSTSTTFHYLGLAVSLPLGLAMVIATVAGGLVVAIAGTARIAQLRKDARRDKQTPPA